MRLSIAVLFVALLCGCNKGTQVDLADATKPQTLTLGAPPNSRELTLKVSGKIDGTAEVSGTQLPPSPVHSKFVLRRDGPFEGTNFVVNYTPSGVRNGKVAAEYEFH